MNSKFAMKNSVMMRTTKTKCATDFPSALCTITTLFSNQQRTQNFHFLRIADSDFDAFVCSEELVCRSALLPSRNRPVVADILVRHCNHFFKSRIAQSVPELSESSDERA